MFKYIFFAFWLLAGNAFGQVFDLPPSLPLDLHRALDNETRRIQRSAGQLENRGEYEKALDLYFEIYHRFPQYNPFYEGIIRCFAALGKHEEGLVWVDSLRTDVLQNARPADLTAMERDRLGNYIVDGGRFAGKIGNSSEALKRWEEIYQIPNLTSAPYYRLFNAMIDIRYPEGLEEMAKKARKATGDPSLLVTSLAGFYTSQGRVDAAIREWLLLMELQPRQAENIKQRILGLPEDENSREQIESSLKAGLSKPAIKLNVVELLGAFYFRSRQWEDAYEQVMLADQIGGNSGLAMLTFAENLITEGEDKLALHVLGDLRKSHEALSNAVRGLLAQAKALESTGSFVEADSVFSRLTTSSNLRTSQGQEALILQAKMRLNQLKEPGKARKLLENALRQQPRMRNSGEAALLIGDTYLAQRKLADASRIYNEAATGRYGRQPLLQSRALVNAALVDFYSGDYERAADRFNEASQKSPNGTLTNNALDMLELLRFGKPDSTLLAVYANAELYLRIGNESKAESLFTEAAENGRENDLTERARLKLAQIMMKSDRVEEAVQILLATIELDPESLRAPSILLKLGQIHQNDINDPVGAVKYYERILIDYPESLQVNEARKRLREMESPET